MVRQIPAEILQSMLNRTPLRRLVKPDEIASIFLLLANDEAYLVSGAVISADGGTVLGF